MGRTAKARRLQVGRAVSAAISTAFALLFGVSCSSEGDGSATDSTSRGVGSACTADSDCGGFDNAACVDEIRPLTDLVDDTGDPANTALLNLTLPFPGGYCGTTADTPCTTDSECGDGGCFLAFEGVSDASVANLNALGLPFDVAEFAAKGICLKPCSSDADCRVDEGYTCIVPLTEFMDVINAEYTKTFCVQDVDVSNLLR